MASDEQSKQNPQETAKTGPVGAKAEAGQSKQAAAQSAVQQSGQSASADAIALLKNDHREVEKLFAEYEQATNRSRKQSIIQQVAQMLKIHAELEEQIFYPAVRQEAEADDKLDEAQVEHDTVKILINALESGARSEFRDAKFKVLSEYVKHHVQEEEASDGILEQGRKAGLDLKQLGQQMAELKQELQADPAQLRAVPVSMGQFDQPKESTAMRQGYDNGNGRGSRGRDDRERDDQGRFTSSRGGYDDDRGGSSRSSRGYDDDRGRSSRSSRDYDDDHGGSSRSGRGGDRSGQGSGQGSGWYGDSQGHSEAARRGWESRDDDDRGGRSGGSRSSQGYDDDDRGGRSGSSRGGGTRSGGRGGWFGDSEGHSEASRRGWESRDDDDRGGGRSGSARSSSSRYEDDDRGGSRSRQSDDDDRRYRSRSRDDEDDRGRGRGGWFGDSRGHSEAARRGWEDRR